jgi:hypothetical protein
MTTLAKLLTAQDDGFVFTIPVNAMFSTNGTGLWSTTAKDVFVHSITMYVEEVYAGDLAVNFDEATWNTSELGFIYTDELFIKQVCKTVKATLLAHGVSKKHARMMCDDIGYSEQGMQDFGRVSCDAHYLADELQIALEDVSML